MKYLILIFICVALSIYGQEASDYYNRPVQEIMEKIQGQVQDTSLVHSGGFSQAYCEVQDWAKKKTSQVPFQDQAAGQVQSSNYIDSHFKSVTSYDSLGVIQLIMHSDCQGLKSNGPNFDYYMSLTVFSKSIKIEFWNIDYKKKDCDKGFRKSLETEVTNLIRDFVDSTLYIHKPSKGLQVIHIIQRRILLDSSIQNYDSIFECAKKDSIVQCSKDSLDAVLSSIKIEPTEAPKIDIDSANRVLDSLEKIVDADSVSLYHEELSFFKKQISCKGRIDVDTRLECVDFFLSNKLRSSVEISKYLIMLYKFCTDKSHMIKAVTVTLPDEEKYKAVAAYHRAQEVCGGISRKQKDINEKDTDH